MDNSSANESVQSSPENMLDFYCLAEQEFIETVAFQVSISPTFYEQLFQA